MPVALITGASRGLGRALAHDLAADGLVARARRPRTPATWPPRPRGLDPARTGLLPGDVTDAAPPRGPASAAAWDLGGLDLLVNNASHLGPSPQPRLADYPPDELAAVYEVDVLAPHALLREALPLLRRSGGARGERQLRRGGRGLRGLGRLRLGQGRARPAVRGARRRGAGPAGLRASTPATCAPRCTSRPSPARTSPTGRSPAPSRCPRFRALLDAAPAERPLPRDRPAAARRERRGDCRRARRRPGRSGRPSMPPEARGLARDGVRLLVARPGSVQHARFRDLRRLPGARRPGRRQHLGARWPPPSTDAGPAGPVTVHLSSELPDGTWAVELRPGRRADGPLPGVAVGDTVELPGGRLRVVAPYPDAAAATSRLWRARLVVPGPVPAYLARHGRPIAYAYVPRRLAARELPDGVRPRAGQRRDAQRRPAVHRPAGHRPGDRRGGRRAGHAAHRRLVAGGGRAAAARAVRGPGGHGAARRPHPPRRRPGRRGRHDGHPGAGDRRRPDGAVRAGERLDRPGARPGRGRPGSSTAW